jgi:glycosyltransferase involved in cell wall biosynthesis
MRLLFVHERMGAFGGAEANIFVTADELRRRGHEVALAFGGGEGREASKWSEVFEERFFLDAKTGEADIQKALAHFSPDLVFIHKMADTGVLKGLFKSNRPTVRMVHDHDLCCMRGYKYNYFSRKICTRAASLYCVFPCGASIARRPGSRFLPVRWVSYWAKRRELALNRKINRLIVATDYMRAELLRNGFAAEKIEIHAPVPRTGRITDQSSFDGRNRIVYAGQIIRGKGVDVLLEALARVQTPFECVILGDGSHRAECERLRDQLGLRDRVCFEGYVPQARIAEFYKDASLAVMSSLWPEPFGATGLEAMRCGLPVVAFDAGGIREWLLDGENGYLVPWMDRDCFAQRVETLLADKTLARQLGENGRRLADQRFNFSAYIDGLEKLFTATTGQSLTPFTAPVMI